MTTRTSYRQGYLYTLRRLGFDLSYNIAFSHNYKVKCSCCEALFINGIPTHETGCINAVHECKGCFNMIPLNQKYCEDCA